MLFFNPLLINYLTYITYLYCYNPIFNYHLIVNVARIIFMFNKDWMQKIEFWDGYFPCALKTIHLNGKHIVDIPNLDQIYHLAISNPSWIII